MIEIVPEKVCRELRVHENVHKLYRFLPGLDKKVDTVAHSFDSSGLAYTHSVQLFLLVFLKVCTEKKYS